MTEGQPKFVTWIHCNCCYFYKEQPDGGPFYLLKCMHVFCQGCFETRVANNGNKCLFCKKVMRVLRIDNSMEPALKAAFDSDPTKGFDAMLRSLDLNTNQMMHLHRGIERAENQMEALNKQEQEIDAEESKLTAILTKVDAMNQAMEKALEQQEKKAKRAEMERQSPRGFADVLSSSQNIKSQRSSISSRSAPFTLMGPPPVPRKSPMVRPNVTRLSSINR